jgi:hypothetical protein
LHLLRYVGHSTFIKLYAKNLANAGDSRAIASVAGKKLVKSENLFENFRQSSSPQHRFFFKRYRLIKILIPDHKPCKFIINNEFNFIN